MNRQVNLGRGPQPMDERNKNIALDYMGGMSRTDICAEYHISNERLSQILRRQAVPQTRVPESKKKSK